MAVGRQADSWNGAGDRKQSWAALAMHAQQARAPARPLNQTGLKSGQAALPPDTHARTHGTRKNHRTRSTQPAHLGEAVEDAAHWSGVEEGDGGADQRGERAQVDHARGAQAGGQVGHRAHAGQALQVGGGRAGGRVEGLRRN